MRKPTTVFYCGDDVPVIGRMTIRGREYATLRKISPGDRQRFWVHDPHAGPRGDFRQVLLLPKNKTSRQHLAVLQNLSQTNPNLPTVLDYEERRHEFVLVTTWVRGEDLEKRHEAIRKNRARPHSPTEAMKLYRGLAHGLSQMHDRRGIVHGDLKPANLVLTRESNRLVMIDFGSAWQIERTTARSPGDGRSAFYAAPELLAGEPTDALSDQFSATLVAYQMITGKLPYGEMGGRAGTPQDRPLYEPLYRPPSRECAQRAKLPRRIWKHIDEILATGLALDREGRFQSKKLWLDAVDDLQCEIRLRVRFSGADKLMIRMFEWFGSRSAGEK